MEFLRRCWGFAIPLALLILAGPVLLLTGVNPSLIVLIVDGGTVVVIVGALLYVVFYDSRRRWPRLSVRDRLTKIITLQR